MFLKKLLPCLMNFLFPPLQAREAREIRDQFRWTLVSLRSSNRVDAAQAAEIVEVAESAFKMNRFEEALERVVEADNLLRHSDEALERVGPLLIGTAVASDMNLFRLRISLDLALEYIPPRFLRKAPETS